MSILERFKRPKSVEVHGVQVIATRTNVGVFGETAMRVKNQAGRADEYAVTLPGGFVLTIQDVCWDNGDRDIRATSRGNAPEAYDGVIDRARLGVATGRDGRAEAYVTLRAIEPGPKRPARKNCNMVHLDWLANENFFDLMTRHGVTDIGTKKDLFDAKRGPGAALAACFPAKRKWAPVLAFVVTTILPILVEEADS